MPEQLPIERGFFRESDDGACVFFPWGVAHRGYVLPDETTRAKAARGPALVCAAAVGVGVWIAHALQPLVESESTPSFGSFWEVLAAPLAVMALVVVGYALWASRFVESFPPSDLQVSRQERLEEAARLSEPGKIFAIGALVAALSTLVFWLEPQAWWMGALGVVVGVGLAGTGAVLHRKRAQLSEPGEEP